MTSLNVPLIVGKGMLTLFALIGSNLMEDIEDWPVAGQCS